MMKAKNLWIVLLTVLIISGCDDNTGSLGMGMLPGSDKITVKTDTFYVKTGSTLAGEVFARTYTGYLGRYTDPEFGYYESSFLTEFYCPENFEFPKPYNKDTNRKDLTMIGDENKAFVSAELDLAFYSFFGDSLNPVRVSVHELNKKLKKSPYTNIIPEDFYDKNQKTLASQTYIIHDVLDTLKNTSPHVMTLKLNDELGKRLIRKNWDSPESFKNATAFINDVFKGVYIKTDFGDGTVFYVDFVQLSVKYQVFRVDSLGEIRQKFNNGGDSTAFQTRIFAANKEVVLANKVVTDNSKLQEKLNDKQHTYIKSPAGIYTSVVLPIQEIADKYSKDTLNTVKMEFTGYRQESVENMYSMSAPAQILLIREKDKKNFFEENLLNDNITSFLSTYSGNQYIFNNLSRLITTCMADKEAVKKGVGKDWSDAQWKTWEDENFKVVLIPIKSEYSSSTLIGIQNDMRPSYVKLKGGEDGESIQVKVTYTRFK